MMNQKFVFLCLFAFQVSLGMHVGAIRLAARPPTRGVQEKPERLFVFNVHDEQNRTERSVSREEVRSIVRDQLHVAFALAERTDFMGDSDFFLTDWNEERCSRTACQEEHLCDHELKELTRFSQDEQRAFCARAIKRGLLPENLDVATFCSNAFNRSWLFKNCYHAVFPQCTCRDTQSLFYHALRACLISRDVSYGSFCADAQLQHKVRVSSLHKVCMCNSYNRRKCTHEKACHETASNMCAGRGFISFLSLLTRINHGDEAFLSYCGNELNAFLVGLASPEARLVSALESPPSSPDSLVVSPASSAPPTPGGRCALGQLKGVLKENWYLLAQILNFSWLEFHAADDQKEPEEETEDEFGGWYAGTASPATQIAELVKRENERTQREAEREKKELSDLVATRCPPMRTFYYQQPLTDAQKKNSDYIIRVCRTGKSMAPFKGTMHRDAESRRLGLVDRVVVRQCAQTCVRCVHEKEQKEQEFLRAQAEQGALLAWMAKQGAVPLFSTDAQDTTTLGALYK